MYDNFGHTFLPLALSSQPYNDLTSLLLKLHPASLLAPGLQTIQFLFFVNKEGEQRVASGLWDHAWLMCTQGNCYDG
jgi:hypothetical protein